MFIPWALAISKAFGIGLVKTFIFLFFNRNWGYS